MLAQSSLPQQQVRPHKLCQHQPLSALPGLEYARSEQVERAIRFSCLVQQRRHLHRQVMPQRDQLSVALQTGQPLFRGFANSLPQLIAFIKNARILWIDSMRTVERIQCFACVATNIEIGDAQVSPVGGEIRIPLC